MPTPTYTPLANITLGSAATTVTMSSISQLYRDLVIVAKPILTIPGNSLQMRFNSDSGNNYSYVAAYGNSGGTGSYAESSVNLIYLGFASGVTDSFVSVSSVNDYSATDNHKPVLTRANTASSGVDMLASRWASTSAISSITFINSSGSTFAAGSTFALYGIAA